MKAVQNLDFRQSLSRIFIFVNSSENLDFSHAFRNISILVELLKETSNLLKFSEKFRLRKKASKNLDFG